jgi:AcrR family transcriptional regulator
MRPQCPATVANVLPESDQLAASEHNRVPAIVVKILEGALRVVGTRGVQRLSMRDICGASGVSRATLYRHFSTKDKVLAAAAEFISISFEAGVREVADRQQDPIDRFRAIMGFFSAYTKGRSPEPMLELEPGFYTTFFRNHFGRHKTAVGEAMALTFDHFDKILGRKIHRDGVAEAMVRMQLSTMLVPVDGDWIAWWDSTPDRLGRWIVEMEAYFRWCEAGGDPAIEQARLMKELETENARLRRAVSDLTLEKLALKEAAAGQF